MKNNKFNVQILNENAEIMKEKQYKSYKEICDDIQLDYHVIRELNKICDGKVQKKFTHDHLTNLSKKLKITTIHNQLNINI
jgi:hypothetical protein